MFQFVVLPCFDLGLTVVHARKFNINAVDCNSVLRVMYMSLFCLCVFCDSFLCSISLLLLSGSLSYIP